jgi:hypothetical protein
MCLDCSGLQIYNLSRRTLSIITDTTDRGGKHAVEMMGWVEEYGEQYWIVLNQYGSHWGEKGRMRKNGYE